VTLSNLTGDCLVPTTW